VPSVEPQLTILPPLRRVFFVKHPGNFLIQVQQNRFLHNWRKVGDDDEYPRYDVAYDRFRNYWQAFKMFLSNVGLPEPKPKVWELTYINHIMAPNAKFPRDMWDFLSFYERSPQATTPMDASSMMMQFGWPLPNDSGKLSLDVKHGNRINDHQEILLMELTVRGRATESDSAMETWFDVAHHAIVNTFERLTTKQAHEQWGKR
jgi:uncharacterized protein (TIGR04255 family)